jgi:hypothetical protein
MPHPQDRAASATQRALRRRQDGEDLLATSAEALWVTQGHNTSLRDRGITA